MAQITVEKLMERIRTYDPAQQQGNPLDNLEARASTGIPCLTSPALTRAIIRERERNVTVYSLPQLLSLPDEDFVWHSYRLLLNRDADQFGLENYVAQLRNGTLSKFDIICQFVISDEWKQHPSEIAGLSTLVRKNRLRHLFKDRIPVIRYAVKWLLTAVKLPTVDHRLELLTPYIETRLAEQRAIFDSIFARHALAMNDTLSDVNRKIDECALEIQRLRHDIGPIGEKVARSEEAIAAVSERLSNATGDIASMLERVSRDEESITSSSKMLSALSGDVESMRQQLLGINHLVVVENVKAHKELHEATLSVDRSLHDNRVDLMDLRSMLGNVINATLMKLSHGGDGQALTDALVGEQLDAMYLELENRFRGSMDEIKDRLKVYIPWIESTKTHGSENPVVDLGCGRGEWLELLGENGIQAKGVDLNRSMVKLCVDRNLDVVEDNVVAYLRSLPGGSLRALTGFHIVEHMETSDLVSLLDEAYKVLEPGGMIILETPNPENLLVGSCNFYLDPTHRNPIPPKLLHFMVESRGFKDAEILRLHPNSDLDKFADALPAEILQFFDAPMDYSVIGAKP